MAIVRMRRRGLGAFDQAAWDAYQASGKTGAFQGPPNGAIEDPNGGVIHFDANGSQDYYTPPASFAAGAPHDNIVEKNPASTFYGWTEYEKAALAAAQGATGAQTDYITQNTPPGTTPTAAVIAESDRRLLAFAASSAKIQDALRQLQTGAFRGAQQSAYDAEEARKIQVEAQGIVDDWMAYRRSFPGQNLPMMPPNDPYLVGRRQAVIDAVRAIVARMPASAPVVAQMTTHATTPIPDYTTSAYGTPVDYHAIPSQPGGGDLSDANPGSSMTGGSGGGPPFPSSGGNAPSLPTSNQMSGAMLLVGAGVLALMLLKRKR